MNCGNLKFLTIEHYLDSQTKQGYKLINAFFLL